MAWKLRLVLKSHYGSVRGCVYALYISFARNSCFLVWSTYFHIIDIWVVGYLECYVD
jgi:hypothetical protein